MDRRVVHLVRQFIKISEILFGHPDNQGVKI